LFDLSPNTGETPKPTEKKRISKKRARIRTGPVTPTPTPPAAAAPDRPDVTPFEWLQLTRVQYSAADIGSMPRHADAEGAGTGAAGAAEAAGTTYGPGEGPGGARLYNAQWVRRPTDAELSFYMPASVPAGAWAMIACQTIPDNRVENCRALGDSVPGSGLAEGLRRAAWQFHVRAPRIGGEPIIGAWVRIRIDFTEHGARPR
jgi:protein TonB